MVAHIKIDFIHVPIAYETSEVEYPSVVQPTYPAHQVPPVQAQSLPPILPAFQHVLDDLPPPDEKQVQIIYVSPINPPKQLKKKRHEIEQELYHIKYERKKIAKFKGYSCHCKPICTDLKDCHRKAVNRFDYRKTRLNKDLDRLLKQEEIQKIRDQYEAKERAQQEQIKTLTQKVDSLTAEVQRLCLENEQLKTQLQHVPSVAASNLFEMELDSTLPMDKDTSKMIDSCLRDMGYYISPSDDGLTPLSSNVDGPTSQPIGFANKPGPIPDHVIEISYETSFHFSPTGVEQTNSFKMKTPVEELTIMKKTTNNNF